MGWGGDGRRMQEMCATVDRLVGAIRILSEPARIVRLIPQTLAPLIVERFAMCEAPGFVSA